MHQQFSTKRGVPSPRGTIVANDNALADLWIKRNMKSGETAALNVPDTMKFPTLPTSAFSRRQRIYLNLSRSRPGRVLLYAAIILLTRKDLRWHARGMLRQFRRNCGAADRPATKL